MPLLLLKNSGSAASLPDELNGRKPIILDCESMNGSHRHPAHLAHQTLNGYPRNNVSRRPPPYRDVPLCRKSAFGCLRREEVATDCGRIPAGNTRYQRAQSVPPRTTCNGNVNKPNRPKSLHQPFSHIHPESNVHLTVPPAFPHVTAFPQSVSLQFDTLSENWHDRHPVPSPAPAERKHRPSRRIDVGVEADKSRSSSVPRTHSFPRSLRTRPLSHPTSLASSLASWSSSLTFQMSGSTPAPAPSPSSSTPSPSRPLDSNHLPHPHDVLRTHHGLHLLEKKLELYVDILTSQERFVQVIHRWPMQPQAFKTLIPHNCQTISNK